MADIHWKDFRNGSCQAGRLHVNVFQTGKLAAGENQTNVAIGLDVIRIATEEPDRIAHFSFDIAYFTMLLESILNLPMRVTLRTLDRLLRR